MFLSIPFGTDAPIYHWPRATVAMIVVNVACLIFVPPPQHSVEVDEEGGVQLVERSSERFDAYAMTLGDGLHPIQWVTHNFLHFGAGHLIGNMIFLWAFGIVIEGKVGMLAFLAIYLAIGTLHGALSQTVLLWSGLHGHAAGASAVVFGLLAMCMFWAPHNELTWYYMYFMGFRAGAGRWDLRFTWVALFYIGEQILYLFLSRLTNEPPLAELAHMSGALWGGVVAYVMLRKGWVDCEGFDLFTVWAKNRKLAKDWKLRGERLDRANQAEKRSSRKVRTVQEDEEPSVEDRSASALRKVRKLIDMGDISAALAAYDKAARALPDWPPAADLLDLIKLMKAQNAEVESVPLLRDYCRKHPENSAKVRLKLAQLLIRHRERPTAGLRVLDEIRDGELPANLEAVRKQLVRQALRMQEEGVLELEGED